MKFVNLTKNTIHLTDLNRDILYLEDKSPQEMSLDDAKRSKGFRRVILAGGFKIVACGKSLFEKNLLRLQSQADELRDETIEKLCKRPQQAIKNKKGISTPNNIEVRLRGHFYELGGYAKVNRNLAIGLHNEGVKVSVEPVNKKNNQLDEDGIIKLSEIHSQVTRNAIVIESVIPTLSISSFGKYNILYTTIEAKTIPKQFLEIANMYHEVWVTSDFCAEVLKSAGFKRNVIVMPNSFDIDAYNSDCEPYEFKPQLRSFIFLSVFGWSYRKGYDVLLKAYLKEFSGDEDVSLLIVSRNHLGVGKNDIIRDEITKFVERYGGNNPPHIARCSKFIPEEIMPSIYKACDAFCLLSRGEGCGMPYIEASLCGLPVIATNCSGQSMFLKHDNSTLLEIDREEPMASGLMPVHYWDNQVFPCLTDPELIKNAGKLMRYVYENYEVVKTKNKKLQQFIRQNYSIPIVSKLAKERLAEIWRK